MAETERESLHTLRSAVTRIVERQAELQSAVTRMVQNQAEIQSEVSRMVSAVERLEERQAEREAERQAESPAERQVECQLERLVERQTELQSAVTQMVSTMERLAVRQEQGDRTLSAADAFLLYSRALEHCRVRFPGDPHFPLAERTWRRLRADFPVSEDVARPVLRAAFAWPALNALEATLCQCPNATADVIWDRIRVRYFTQSHLNDLLSNYLRFSMRPKEKTAVGVDSHMDSLLLLDAQNAWEDLKREIRGGNAVARR